MHKISSERQTNYSQHPDLMKRTLLLVGTLVSLGINVQAQDHDFFKTAIRCGEIIDNLNYEDAYQKGRFHAQAFNTALSRKDWTAEESKYLDVSRFTSRHGLGGMTDGAQLLIKMLHAKIENKPLNLRSRDNACLMGEFQIYKKQPWSPVHSGFTDHLSPELRSFYFSLPAE